MPPTSGAIPALTDPTSFAARLKKLARSRRVRWAIRGVAAGLLGLGFLAGSDLLAFYRASSFERAGDSAAPAVARHWSELLERHPSLPTFWPGLARQARLKQAEWQVKAAGIQVANGTAPPDLGSRLDQLKDQTPQLAPAIRKVEAAQEVVRHDERWRAVQAEAQSLVAIDDPATPLATIDAFLHSYPETPPRRGTRARTGAENRARHKEDRGRAADRRRLDPR